MRIWKRAREEQDEVDTMELVAASLRTAMPTPTGDVMQDHWNDAISCAQAYLNGKAIGTDSDSEKLLILSLRADLNWLHMKPTDD